MNPLQLDADTEALIQGYLEGTLTPEDSTRLLTAIKSRPELIPELLDGLRMDTLIRQVVAQTEAISRSASKTSLPEAAFRPDTGERKEVDQCPCSRLKSAALLWPLRLLWECPMVLVRAALLGRQVGQAHKRRPVAALQSVGARFAEF